MTPQEVARKIVSQIKADQLFGMYKRFDARGKNYRVYGRITDTVGCEVVMIQNIHIETKYQGKGIFNALVDELKKEFGLRIYIQCVGNESWAKSLRRSPKWEAVGSLHFISR